jgi:hypothetical protein
MVVNTARKITLSNQSLSLRKTVDMLRNMSYKIKHRKI